MISNMWDVLYSLSFLLYVWWSSTMPIHSAKFISSFLIPWSSPHIMPANFWGFQTPPPAADIICGHSRPLIHWSSLYSCTISLSHRSTPVLRFTFIWKGSHTATPFQRITVWRCTSVTPPRMKYHIFPISLTAFCYQLPPSPLSSVGGVYLLLPVPRLVGALALSLYRAPTGGQRYTKLVRADHLFLWWKANSNKI